MGYDSGSEIEYDPILQNHPKHEAGVAMKILTLGLAICGAVLGAQNYQMYQQIKAFGDANKTLAENNGALNEENKALRSNIDKIQGQAKQMVMFLR